MPDRISHKRIIITGPESSGKSTLAQALGKELELPVVEEYALEYLQATKGNYTFEDLAEIAEGQHQSEMEALEKFGPPIICDTSMLVIKVWTEVRFGQVDPLVLKYLSERSNDLYLLCKPDLDWVPGPFRENPNDRDQLFEKYLEFLVSNRYHWGLIEGENRLFNSREILKNFGFG